MKHIPLLLAATLALSTAARSQTQIAAPRGWKTQTRAGGARTFVPPDLRAGEVYRVTIYDSAPMNGQTPEEYLRAFAGKVGKTAGQLAAPLQFSDQGVTGFGTYNGPNGAELSVVFFGVSLDGANIHVERILFSSASLINRYKAATNVISESLGKRVGAEAIENGVEQAGDNVLAVPGTGVVSQKLKVIGGPIQPGVYAGNQFDGQELRQRFRVYLYPTGEYRLCDQNDEDIKEGYLDEQVGNIKYNRNSGKLDIDWTMGLGTYNDDGWCYYGLDASGKPAIYAEEDRGVSTKRTLLTYVGPPTKRPSESQAKEAEDSAKAERNRYKWVVAPGRGVPDAQIAAIIRHFDVDLEPGMTGLTSHTTDEAFLLLRNGTVYAGLPVPPGEFDVVRSRQHEPTKWGKWRQVGGRYQVSWQGAPFQALPGSKVLPAPAGLRLNGYYRAVSSSSNALGSSLSIWGVTFGPDGRFRKSTGGSSIIGSPNSPAGVITTTHDENGTFVGGDNFSVSSKKKNNPNGNSEGTYELNGYTLTLRYDNGRVARWPFFFSDRIHDELWFENGSVALSNDK